MLAEVEGPKWIQSGGDVERCGHADVRVVHRGLGFLGGGVVVAGLHLGAGVEVGEAVDDLPRHVGAAGVLEEGLALERGLGERGEVGAEARGIEGQGHGALSVAGVPGAARDRATAWREWAPALAWGQGAGGRRGVGSGHCA